MTAHSQFSYQQQFSLISHIFLQHIILYQMTKPISTDVVFANNQLRPLEYEGVKLMSMGFINKGASIMRGPMVNQVKKYR